MCARDINFIARPAHNGVMLRQIPASALQPGMLALYRVDTMWGVKTTCLQLPLPEAVQTGYREIASVSDTVVNSKGARYVDIEYTNGGGMSPEPEALIWVRA